MLFWTATTLKNIKNLSNSQKVLKNKGKEPSLLAHKLTCLLLEQISSKHGWSISKKDSGQPIAISETNTQPYNISLSHSKEWIACAISNSGPVGIDIEFHKQRNFNKLAAFGFGKNEQKRIEINGKDEFYKIWTLREAYAKMKSASILSTLHGNNIITCDNKTSYWKEEKANFFYKKINKDYSLGIASNPSTAWNSTYLSVIDVSDLFKEVLPPKS